MNRILIGTTTPSQSRPESNGNERVTPLSLELEPQNQMQLYPGHLLFGGGGCSFACSAEDAVLSVCVRVFDCLVLNGISTQVGYLIPNIVFVI